MKYAVEIPIIPVPTTMADGVFMAAMSIRALWLKGLSDLQKAGLGFQVDKIVYDLQ